MEGLPYIMIYFLKTLIAFEIKVFSEPDLNFPWFLTGRFAKNWIFHQKNILQYYF